MDQLIAGPSLLRYVLNQTGSDINSAQSTAAAWRNARKADELAKGVNAGEGGMKRQTQHFRLPRGKDADSFRSVAAIVPPPSG